MAKTFFVLSFEVTYGNEIDTECEVSPLVYLIDEKEQQQIADIAIEAADQFADEEDDMCIGDLFEDNLREAGIEFQFVGELKRNCHIAPYIPIAVV